MSAPPAWGKREAQKRKVREGIIEACYRLVAQRGFDNVSVETIAQAANVSRRTFFRYFATKEDAIFAWQDDNAGHLAALVLSRPPREKPIAAAIRGVESFLAAFPYEETKAMASVFLDMEGVRDGIARRWIDAERRIAEALVAREGKKSEDNLGSWMAAAIAVAAWRIGTDRWTADGRVRTVHDHYCEVIRSVAVPADLGPLLLIAVEPSAER